jgi:LPS sulfotransferase NodH
MNITKSYRIYTGTRTGHTVLGKMLELTGRAGCPGEHLNIHDAPSLCEKYGAFKYDTLKEKIWQAGSKGQDIFSCKMDGYGYYMIKVRDEMMELRGWKGGNEEEFWSDIFPGCKNILLTRRNKVRQAVSW